MTEVGAVPVLAGRRRYETGNWPAPVGKHVPVTLAGVELPIWTGLPAHEPERAQQTLSPSDLGGEKALPGETAGLSEDAAKARGTVLHALLELMPLTAQTEWPALAAGLIPDLAVCEDLLAEAAAVLTAPQLAHLFGPGTRAEVPITAEISGRRLLGTIDRLIITPTTITAIDFKSNVVIPQHAAQIPEGLLRQIGAYADALRQIFPDHRIETAILWTRTVQLMPLVADIVRAALARAAIA